MPIEGEGESTNATANAPENSGQGQSGQAKAFTQEQLDAIIGERAKRASEAALKGLFEKLGVKDDQELDAMVKAKRDRDNAEKSDLQKTQEAAAELQAKLEAAEQRAAAAEAQRIADRVDARIAAIAGKQRAQYPDDVVEYLRKSYRDELAKAVKDDGAVDEKALETLIGKVKADRPNWFSSGDPGSPSNSGGRNPQADASTLKRAAEENKRRIRDQF